MADLTDKVAVITGGGRGIGAATARLLAGEGCQVVLAARTPGELEEMRHQIEEGGGRVLSVRTDVASEEDVVHLFAEAKREFGPVEILVNNAGILERMPVHEMDVETWDRVLGVNLRGVFLCAREAMRQMIPRKHGSIINISSIAGVAGIEKWSGSAAYCASKGGVNLFTEVLSVEGKLHGIRVNSISPGAVQTRMWEQNSSEEADISPDDVAKTVLFLLSDEAGTMQGSNLEMFGR